MAARGSERGAWRRKMDKRLGGFRGQRDGSDTGFSLCTSGDDDDDGFRKESLPPRSIRGEQN